MHDRFGPRAGPERGIIPLSLIRTLDGSETSTDSENTHYSTCVHLSMESGAGESSHKGTQVRMQGDTVQLLVMYAHWGCSVTRLRDMWLLEQAHFTIISMGTRLTLYCSAVAKWSQNKCGVGGAQVPIIMRLAES